MSMKQKILILVLLIFVFPQVFATNNYLIADSNDWHSLYLLSLYSAKINYSFLYFENLADSQIKLELIPKNSNILFLNQDQNQ